MAERQRRTAVSIIEEIQKRRGEAADELETLNAHRDELIVKIGTLSSLLDAVDKVPLMPMSEK